TEGTIALFKDKPTLKKLFERISVAALPKKGAYLSNAVDEVVSAEHGYGEGNQKPEDYLESFAAFVKENQNAIEGLKIVCTSPKSLTRKQLKELRIKLDAAGYPEASVRAAWKDVKQQDIAASIIGFVRQRALGSPLVPYEQRVERALKKIIESEAWTAPQLSWLKSIGAAVKNQHIVVEELLEGEAFVSKGGFARGDKTFDGRLRDVLDRLGNEIWRDDAA
ncbi:MAG TPA: type I restriction-modification enzyme R subunit C-terminal domain-containing protein, partial [Archangium sp.]